MILDAFPINQVGNIWCIDKLLTGVDFGVDKGHRVNDSRLKVSSTCMRIDMSRRHFKLYFPPLLTSGVKCGREIMFHDTISAHTSSC